MFCLLYLPPGNNQTWKLIFTWPYTLKYKWSYLEVEHTQQFHIASEKIKKTKKNKMKCGIFPPLLSRFINKKLDGLASSFVSLRSISAPSLLSPAPKITCHFLCHWCLPGMLCCNIDTSVPGKRMLELYGDLSAGSRVWTLSTGPVHLLVSPLYPRRRMCLWIRAYRQSSSYFES